jgi:predicted permease
MWLPTLAQDLRYGARQLRLNPGFTLVAVMSLALGIGANTAIFQLVDAVRLRRLPVERPQDLVYIDFARGAMRSGWFSTRSARLTSALWNEIRKQTQPFNGMLAWSAGRFNLAQGGETRNAQGLFVSGDFFRALGVQAIVGRTFTAADDQPGCGSPGAVISYAFWQREFGGETGALGRTVNLDGRPFPVLGVTPAGFFGVEVGNRYDVALPLCADRLFWPDGKGRGPNRTAWWISAMGRLKPGWTAERANAQLQAASPGIMEASLPSDYRQDDAKRFLKNRLAATAGGTGVSQLRREYEQPLWLLLATTGLVLLIACANLANLLLARASVREREIAVRQAIGASRGRLIAQLLSERLLLAVSGALLGALIAQSLSSGLVAFLSTPRDPLFVGLGMDLRVLGFTAAIAIITCLLFGLLPAVRATRIQPASAMRGSGRGVTAGRERFGLRRALVVAQVALSLVLVVGAMLFVRSLQKLLAVDMGFRPDGLITVSLDLRGPGFDKQRLPVVYDELLKHIQSRPGVVSAAQVSFTPVSGSGWNNMVQPVGSTAARKESNFNRASPGYFRTMGTALVAGRDFNDRDTLASTKVAIVNEAFARRILEDPNPVGRLFRVEAREGKADPVYQVVGVVRNTKYYEIREDALPIAFFPMSQEDDPGTDATYVLRTTAPLGEAFRGVKSAVAEVHPRIDIEFRVLTEQLKTSLTRDRLMATLAGAFGLLAGLLATLGLYGVIAYMVARRRNEIGVRIALGADRARVVRLVLREAAILVAVGIVIGSGLAILAGRAAATLLFALKPYDPLTLGGAVVLLAAVGLLASFAPARRASRLEPMQALREE